MYKQVCKIIFFLFVSCNSTDKNLSETIRKIVLVNSEPAKISGTRLDSIVYTYRDIVKNNKMYVSQTFYFNRDIPAFTNWYYLFADEKYLYVGLPSENYDTIVYYPYCSFTLHDTIKYKVDPYLEPEGGKGFTVYTRELDSHRREYEGMFFLYGNLYFQEQQSWILDENNKPDKIQIGQLLLEKKTDEEILSAESDFKPNNNSVDVFMPPQFGLPWWIEKFKDSSKN